MAALLPYLVQLGLAIAIFKGKVDLVMFTIAKIFEAYSAHTYNKLVLGRNGENLNTELTTNINA